MFRRETRFQRMARNADRHLCARRDSPGGNRRERQGRFSEVNARRSRGECHIQPVVHNYFSGRATRCNDCPSDTFRKHPRFEVLFANLNRINACSDSAANRRSKRHFGIAAVRAGEGAAVRDVAQNRLRIAAQCLPNRGGALLPPAQRPERPVRRPLRAPRGVAESESGRDNASRNNCVPRDRATAEKSAAHQAEKNQGKEERAAGGSSGRADQRAFSSAVMRSATSR